MSNKDTIRLSIITSCYTDTPFFAEMLDSFLQSGYHFRNTEILICDDCSPAGGEGDVARAYAQKYPDLIRVIRNESRLHVRKSFQRLSENARGEYIMPFDSDDIFVPFDIDGSMDFLDRNPRYCATYGKKRLFNREDGDMGQIHGGDYSLFAIAIDPRMTHNAMIIRTSDLRQSGGYLPSWFPKDETLLPDVVLWVGMAMRKEFYYDGTLRALYRRHENQYSNVEQYGSGYNILRSSLARAYPGIYNAIINRQQMQITQEQRFITVALLGAAWAEEAMAGGNQTKLLEYCNAAQILMPGDYGIREYRMKTLMAQQRFAEVLSQTMLMSQENPGQVYIQQLSMMWAADAAGKLNIPADEFNSKRMQIMMEHFAMNDAQQRLLRQTVANFRK